MGWFRTVALAAVATAALTGAATAQVTYNRGNDADPETLDPHKTSTVYEAHILRDLYEGLVTHDAKGEVVPGVAEKWEISDDGKVYRFTLRDQREMVERRPGEGVRLRLLLPPHHGPGRPARNTPTSSIPILNAEKVNKGQGRKLEELGVKAVDDRDARDHARAADALLPRAPDPPDRLPRASGHRREVRRRTSSSPRTWSRTAPIMLEGVRAELAHRACRRTRISTPPRTSRSTRSTTCRSRTCPPRLRRFKAGELQSTSDIPADQIKFLKEKLGDQVKISPYLGTWYLAVNTVEEALRRRARAPGAVDRHRPRVHRRARSGRAPCCRPTRSCRRASAITASPRQPTTRTSRRSTARTRRRRC